MVSPKWGMENIKRPLQPSPWSEKLVANPVPTDAFVEPYVCQEKARDFGALLLVRSFNAFNALMLCGCPAFSPLVYKPHQIRRLRVRRTAPTQQQAVLFKVQGSQPAV